VQNGSRLMRLHLISGELAPVTASWSDRTSPPCYNRRTLTDAMSVLMILLIMWGMRPWSIGRTARGCRIGWSDCSHLCSATRFTSATSSIYPQRRWWNLAVRFQFEGNGWIGTRKIGASTALSAPSRVPTTSQRWEATRLLPEGTYNGPPPRLVCSWRHTAAVTTVFFPLLKADRPFSSPISRPRTAMTRCDMIAPHGVVLRHWGLKGDKIAQQTVVQAWLE
jgi:hypothetical protein